MSSRLDWDADTIFPLYGRIIDDGAIWWSGGAGSGGVVGGENLANEKPIEKQKKGSARMVFG